MMRSRIRVSFLSLGLGWSLVLAPLVSAAPSAGGLWESVRQGDKESVVALALARLGGQLTPERLAGAGPDGVELGWALAEVSMATEEAIAWAEAALRAADALGRDALPPRLRTLTQKELLEWAAFQDLSGDPLGALATLDRLADWGPVSEEDGIAARLLRAQLLRAVGEPEAALKVLTELRSAFPGTEGDLKAAWLSGEVLWRMGRFDEARRLYGLVAGANPGFLYLPALERARRRSASPAVPTPAPRDSLVEYGVQVGAYADRDHALDLVRRLPPTLPVVLFTEDRRTAPGHPLFKVRIGPFGRRAEAEEALADLARSQHLSGFIVALPSGSFAEQKEVQP